MNLKINRSILKGSVEAPPSKSMAHRMLIVASLVGNTTVQGIELSEDIKATLRCLTALGAEIIVKGDNAIVVSPVKRQNETVHLDCGESGSTLRFMIPIAAQIGGDFVFTGAGRLLERPLSAYDALFGDTKVNFFHSASEVTLSGNFSFDNVCVDVGASSQFITGILFALALSDNGGTVRAVGELQSRPYVDMTISALDKIGVCVTEGSGEYEVNTVKRFSPKFLSVEKDWSNAAFFDALGLIGYDVNVTGLDSQSLQGDKAYKECFEEIKKGFTRIDIKNTPDLAPVYMALGAANHGVKLTGTSRLKLKESDRGLAMIEELAKFSIYAECDEDSVTVYGKELSVPVEPIYPHNDHRIAMAMSLLLLKTGGVLVNAECTAKSMPRFFDILTELGAEIEQIG